MRTPATIVQIVSTLRQRSEGLRGAHERRLLQFALVGTLGVLVNTTLLALLVEVGGLHPVVASALATEAAILGNFALNDRWTFRDAHPLHASARGWMRRAVHYHLVALGGLVVSVGVLAALTGGLRLHYLAANGCAVGAGFLWNYAGNCRLTWSPSLGHQRAAPTPVPRRQREGRRGPRGATLPSEVGQPWI